MFESSECSIVMRTGVLRVRVVRGTPPSTTLQGSGHYTRPQLSTIGIQLLHASLPGYQLANMLTKQE